MDGLQLVAVLTVVFVIARALFRMLTSAIWAGKPWRAVCAVWLTSPVQLSLVAIFGEGRDLSWLTDVSSLPMSLVIGDIVVVPAGAAAAAKIAQYVDLAELPGWALSRRWFYCSAAIGVGVGLGFHLLDSAGYVALGVGALVVAATKVIHDLVVFPVLVAALVYGVVPLLKLGGWRIIWKWLVVGCVVAWLALVLWDGQRGLDPRDFHTTCDILCASDNIAQHLRLDAAAQWLGDALRSLRLLR